MVQLRKQTIFSNRYMNRKDFHVT